MSSCQLVITWAGAELPELRTQLYSGGKSGTAVVTASGSPLPCLVVVNKVKEDGPFWDFR